MQIYFSLTFFKIPYHAKILFDNKKMVTKKVLRKLFLKRLISAKLYCQMNRLKKKIGRKKSTIENLSCCPNSEILNAKNYLDFQNLNYSELKMPYRVARYLYCCSWRVLYWYINV